MWKARTLSWVGMNILPLPGTLPLPTRRAMGSLGTVWNLCESSFVLQRFTRAGTYSGHLKQAIDLKMELELALKKYEELNIEPGGGQRNRVSS